MAHHRGMLYVFRQACDGGHMVMMVALTVFFCQGWRDQGHTQQDD
jgi:hypothetical protein